MVICSLDMTLLQDRVIKIRWFVESVIPGSETSCVPVNGQPVFTTGSLGYLEIPKDNQLTCPCLPKTPVVDDLAFAKQSNQLPA